MADHWSSSSLGLDRQMMDFDVSVNQPMDEVAFESLEPEAQTCNGPWQPGIWAHMIALVSIFAPIQNLNHRCAQGDTSPDQLDAEVVLLSQQLENWEHTLPPTDVMSERTLARHCKNGIGGRFVALHLGYHFYSTLLYFRFLEHNYSASPAVQRYKQKCKHHALSYSKLLQRSRQGPDCDVLYPTVGHMAVVSSSVLVHTLLFGEERELQPARHALNANFEAIVELGQHWPNIAPMVSSLILSSRQVNVHTSHLAS
jgi:hypothetical protein